METIKRLEKMDGPLLEVRAATVAQIQLAFEREGIEFTNGDAPGLRTRVGRQLKPDELAHRQVFQFPRFDPNRRQLKRGSKA